MNTSSTSIYQKIGMGMGIGIGAGAGIGDEPKSAEKTDGLVGAHLLRGRVLPDRREAILRAVRNHGQPELPGKHSAVAGIY